MLVLLLTELRLNDQTAIVYYIMHSHFNLVVMKHLGLDALLHCSH